MGTSNRDTMKQWCLAVLFIYIKRSEALSLETRLSQLENRVGNLESAFDDFEPKFAARYNLNRTCTTPDVINGEAICKYKTCKFGSCSKKLNIGDECTVVCNPGFIASPTKDVTHCKDDGGWTVELKCEIPLLLISGGNVGNGNSGDSTVEALSLYPSHGCNIKIPDMPKKEGHHRRMNNLLYISPQKVLACNGITGEAKASCDIWSSGNNTWKSHSFPNLGTEIVESDCNRGSDRSSFFNYRMKCPDIRKKGRYAAQAQHVAGETLVLGGMVYDKEGHQPTATLRILTRQYLSSSRGFSDAWRYGDDMVVGRSFFCSVNIKEKGILSIGGLSKTANGNRLERSVEFKKIDRIGYPEDTSLQTHSTFSDMEYPRSGHACAVLPGDDIKVLVSGGFKAFNGGASTDGEIYNWSRNVWNKAGDMNAARVGHALVTVGSKVFAVGGEYRTGHDIMDTIEEYDVRSNSWKIIETKMKKPRSNFGFTLVPHSLFPGCSITDPLTE